MKRQFGLLLLAAALTAANCGGQSNGADATARVITVDIEHEGVPFDHRVLGTNAPAWIPTSQLTDPMFHEKIAAMGSPLIRMPGGSWSSEYDWLACERRDGCKWEWAARPSDFASLLVGSGAEGMWTLSFNGTAKEAAALVAFFNGRSDDETPIGRDRHGTDWGTVGQWAEMRAAGGHPDPVRVEFWEIGNEVFGASPDVAAGCASYGWELVWTCDGAEYIFGDDMHDGYLDFRREMLKIDPSIRIGAVGLAGDQEAWNGFGEDVVASTKSELDFYIVHDYGFNDAVSSDEVLGRPSEYWPTALTEAREILEQANPGVPVPIAVTEYNLFAFSDADQQGLMAEAISAFYIADTIGQMALNGVSIANHWNLVNGESASGSDYGIFDSVSGDVNPAWYAFVLWSRFGDELIPVSVGSDLDKSLRAYGGTNRDGLVTVLVMNPTDEPITASIDLQGAARVVRGTADVVHASALDARDMEFNGDTATPLGFETRSGVPIPTTDAGTLRQTFMPVSLTLVSVETQ